MAAPIVKIVGAVSRKALQLHTFLPETRLPIQKCKSSTFVKNSLSLNSVRKLRNFKLIGLSVATGAFAIYGYRQSQYYSPIIACHPDSHSLLPPVHAAIPSDDKNSPSSRLNQFNFIADVVEKASPAVVYIEIKGRHPYHGGQVTVSNGSGFIVKEDGLVLTNAHVVANKQNVKIRLNDGRIFDGVVQAVDPVSDLATIRIPCSNLPYIKLSSSAEVRPGEWVVAMGSPFSLSNTVTAGIVSTAKRGSKELGMVHKDMDYIQTDAVINFGNSGGPLVNLAGEAVGINTMKVTTGISFAIPADYATKFLEKVDKLNKRSSNTGLFGRSSKSPTVVKRRYIGVTMLTLTPDIIDLLRLGKEVTHGVRVERVVIGSPVYRSGIRPGDIVVGINDGKIMSVSDVYKAVDSGKDLKFTILRESQQLQFTVIPEEVE